MRCDQKVQRLFQLRTNGPSCKKELFVPSVLNLFPGHHNRLQSLNGVLCQRLELEKGKDKGLIGFYVVILLLFLLVLAF